MRQAKAIERSFCPFSAEKKTFYAKYLINLGQAHSKSICGWCDNGREKEKVRDRK